MNNDTVMRIPELKIFIKEITSRCMGRIFLDFEAPYWVDVPSNHPAESLQTVDSAGRLHLQTVLPIFFHSQ
jgi:hypothetical protein